MQKNDKNICKGVVQMKKVLILLFFLIFLIGCQKQSQIEPTQLVQNNIQENSTIDNEIDEKQGEPNMRQLFIRIDDQEFSVTLQQNKTVDAFIKQLPMTITMDDLHGNEKYYYMNQSLPTQSQPVSSIKAGDLMLFGNNCLVLFYQSFQTSYSYTYLGHIEDVDAFMNKINDGSIRLTIHQ